MSTPDKLAECAFDELENLTLDVSSNEFRTTDGRLSTWQIESLEELDEAALAIIMGGDRIEKIQVIVLDIAEVEKSFAIEETAGRTCIPSLIDKHRDITNLTHGSLDPLLRLYKRAVDEKRCMLYTKGEAENLVKEAIKQDRVDFKAAPSKLQTALHKLAEGNTTSTSV